MFPFESKGGLSESLSDCYLEQLLLELPAVPLLSGDNS